MADRRSHVETAADCMENAARARKNRPRRMIRGCAIWFAVLTWNLQFNTTSTNLQLTAEGLRLRVARARGTNVVVILVATNLVNWESLTTNLPVFGSGGIYRALPDCASGDWKWRSPWR